DGTLQRRDGAELRELAAAPLPLGRAAKEGNRAFVARVIAARTVEDRREATVRVLQVRDKVEAEVAPKAALHARTARRHPVGGRSRGLQGRGHAMYVLSESGRCQQRGPTHEDVRRSLGL